MFNPVLNTVILQYEIIPEYIPKTSVCPDLEFVKKIYTTQFSGEKILHTENA